MRRLLLTLGLLVLAGLWMLLASGLNRESFAVHMLVHMGVVVVAAPMLAVSVSGTRFDPSRRHAWLAPIPASLVELVIVWGWHAPAMRQWAETSITAAFIEQACFLIGGMALWLACLNPGPGRRAAGIIALLLTSMHMTLLGVLLTMAPRPLYGEGSVTCLGVVLSAEQDQQSGGVIMLLLGAAAYLAGGLYLMAGALRQAEPEGSR